MTRLVPGDADYFEKHVPIYLETNGFEGHFVDLSAYGGDKPTTVLILKSTGRRSGKARLNALIYDNVGPEYVIIASYSGAPTHPDWYFNLTAAPEVEFQVADKCFRGTWRVAEGAERARVWDQMAAYWPPYPEYQTRTEREIPVVMLAVTESIPAL